MSQSAILAQLRSIAAADDFACSSGELTASWTEAGLGLEVVDPVLQFMEEHPTLDFGVPGPLVHFVERFYQWGYEERLVASINRHPTVMTVWLLNRLINGTQSLTEKQQWISVLRQAANKSKCDQQTLESIRRFLHRVDSMQ